MLNLAMAMSAAEASLQPATVLRLGGRTIVAHLRHSTRDTQLGASVVYSWPQNVCAASSILELLIVYYTALWLFYARD